MEKRRQILEPVIFLIFCMIASWLLRIFEQYYSTSYQLFPYIIFQWILYLILGILLNCVNRKFDFHSRHFSPFHLTVVLVCVLFVVACYIPNVSMPDFAINNRDIMELLLLSYAGANLPSAFFGR